MPTKRSYLDNTASMLPSMLEHLRNSIEDVRKNWNESINGYPFFNGPFSWLGWIVEDLERLGANGHDTSAHYPIKEKATELVKTFCDRWKEEYFGKSRAALKDFVRRYSLILDDLEERIKKENLAEDNFEENHDYFFVMRGQLDHIFTGIRTASYTKETDLQRYESEVAEIDKRFRQLIPIFAETYANLEPRLFRLTSVAYLKRWWWEHELYRFYKIYHAKLPAGTPTRGLRD